MKPNNEVSAKNAASKTKRAVLRLHIFPHSEGWAVGERVNAKPSRTLRTQNEAIEVAKQMGGKDSEIVVHAFDKSMTYTLSNSPADEMMFDYWQGLHADSSTAKEQRVTRKAS